MLPGLAWQYLSPITTETSIEIYILEKHFDS